MQDCKICIWMNITSHYQSAFFAALRQRDDVDLEVRYLHGVSDSRGMEGWANSHNYKEYEKCVAGSRSPQDMAETVLDWRERIHVLNSNFSNNLIELFCKEHVEWVHWSEMPGIRLASMLGYRMELYRFLHPLMLLLKYRDGNQIKQHALGALGQGVLAGKSFRRMGVPQEKIADLYYSPAPLPIMDPCQQVQKFAKGRQVFLSVGALCKRKGIDVLLKAFAQLKAENWCLVLCGLDKESGVFHRMAERLNIVDRILFLGAYPVKNIAKVYNASDVLILASRFDGWGAVLNEASSLGLSLIGTDMCGASWHMIEDGVNGFRVRAGSVRKLRQGMQHYVDNPILLEKHGVKSRALFLEKFTPQRNAERLVKALQDWSHQ